MSLYEANLSKFIYIIQTQPNLLSAEDWLSLEELLLTVPDDIKELSNEIIAWRNNRPAIKDAMRKLPKEETGDKGLKDQPTNLKPQEFKKIIKNETRQHKSSSNQSSKSKSKK